MSRSTLAVAGRAVDIADDGDGPPLLYLHGFTDLHGIEGEPMAFHRALAASHRVIAPAHPGCAGSDDDENIATVDDVVFHYLRVLDALGLDRCALAGSCIGGWIAAEIAVRHPERVSALVLLGATGLHVPGHPIGDVFWYAQPDDGVRYDGLRRLFFADAATEAGVAMIPDRKDALDRELRKYRVFRFASLIGFSPPYLYDPRLRGRLDRYGGPALVLWGEHDRMVPRAHAEAWFEGLAGARLDVLAGCGHSIAAEAPDRAAAIVAEFLAG